MCFSRCSKAHFLPLTAGKGKLGFLEAKDKTQDFLVGLNRLVSGLLDTTESLKI